MIKNITIDTQYKSLPSKVIFVKIVSYQIKDPEQNLMQRVYAQLASGLWKKF